MTINRFKKKMANQQYTTTAADAAAAWAERLKTVASYRGKADPRPLPGQPTASAAPAPLPEWPDAVRALPNAFLRSALFGAMAKVAKGRRRYLERELVASIDGVEILYTGQRLDQRDLDVWASILHAMRHQEWDQEWGAMCRITSYSLLKMNDKTDTGKNRDKLLERIERLRATALTVKAGRYTYIGGLLSSAVRDEVTKEWIIELDSKLLPLFARDAFTLVDWSVRRSLGDHPLAEWLHAMYSSHASPYPMKIHTLRDLSGSTTADLGKFAQLLRKALDAVTEACTAHGQPLKYEIRDGLVHVDKTATKSQARHLEKKRAVKPRKAAA